MKALIVYYSLTNYTKLVADTLADALSCDLRPLVDKKKRKGILGYIFSAVDALLAKRAKLVDPDYNLEGYDYIIIGSPIWVGRPTPAVLTFFDNIDLKGKKVVLYVTMGGPSSAEAINIMAGYVKQKGGEMIYMFSIQSGNQKKRDIYNLANQFAEQIKSLNK